MSDRFATRLLAWFDEHGRKDLPWQQATAGARDPYPIWVSEIMLQQTQVSTVMSYFGRFVARFPTIESLADADIDEVLHLWTGLGYYARARNLHRAAKLAIERHGRFPTQLEDVCALPGIGISTAGAILAFAFDQHHAILDGNVRRVLARYHAVEGWPGKKDVEKRLWELARAHTPQVRVADYTQAIMDLGATVCRRTPACGLCPVTEDCRAYAQGTPAAYPAPPPRRRLPVKSVTMLMIVEDEAVLLARRPPTGIWGGLWGFPEVDDATDARVWCQERLGLDVEMRSSWPVVRHTFSHFHLDITPLPLRPLGRTDRLMETGDTVWYKLTSPDARGFAAPVKRLLEQLRVSQSFGDP